MRVRRVPLFEFMPYGAPELLESSRVHLARAVFTGALGWSLAFVLLAASGLFRVPPAPKRLPTLFDVTISPSLLPPPETRPAAAASKPVRPQGRPVAVPVAGAPADAPVEPISGDGTATPGDARQAIAGKTPALDRPVVIPAAERTYQVHEVDQLPEVVLGPRPVYASFAREAQVEGLVVVRALVGRDGKVARAEIERSIPLLDPSALDAVRDWTFTPARVSGRPVAVWIVIPFRFRLH